MPCLLLPAQYYSDFFVIPSTSEGDCTHVLARIDFLELFPVHLDLYLHIPAISHHDLGHLHAYFHGISTSLVLSLVARSWSSFSVHLIKSIQSAKRTSTGNLTLILTLLSESSNTSCIMFSIMRLNSFSDPCRTPQLFGMCCLSHRHSATPLWKQCTIQHFPYPFISCQL